MKRAYIFVFADAVGRADTVKDIIKTVPGIISWRYDMGHAMYLISEEGADTIARRIREKIPKGRFIVTELHPGSNEQTQGWLTPDSWHMIREKEKKTE